MATVAYPGRFASARAAWFSSVNASLMGSLRPTGYLTSINRRRVRVLLRPAPPNDGLPLQQDLSLANNLLSGIAEAS